MGVLQFGRKLRALCLTRKTKWAKIIKGVSYLTRSNVVLHASIGAKNGLSYRRARIIGAATVHTVPAHPVFEQLSQQGASSPFTHFRFHTKRHGKLLVFKTGNIIRAGKSTHADAYNALIIFMRWVRTLVPGLAAMWPCAVSLPNSVWTGQFLAPISAGLKQHPRATYSDRFPGISYRLKTNTTVTPEIFLKASKWILPGTKTACDVFDALDELVDLHATLGKSVSV